MPEHPASRPPSGPLGIAVNPASGKDIRRLVARASVFDNQEKCAIVKRALVGALAASVPAIRYVADTHGIAESAVHEILVANSGVSAASVSSPQTGSELDTRCGAAALHAAGCRAVITLGGDGTNRAFVRGWRDAPLIALSTGTNNAFPQFWEATIAGAAAGLVAAGHVALTEVAVAAKVIDIDVDGESPDLALIDAVLTSERFVGARALLAPECLRVALLTYADPAAVGVAGIGGLLCTVERDEPSGLCVDFGPGGRVLHAPIAPGLWKAVPVRNARPIAVDETIEVRGPGVLAFDGERERELRPGQRARLTLRRDGPWVIDVRRALRLGAERAVFTMEAADAD